MLPPLTPRGELPIGVHASGWSEFQSRFGFSSPRRVWLIERLRKLLDLAAESGKLSRVFVWGSFVTAKLAPGDVDVLLLMASDFEVDALAAETREVFDAVHAKLLFEADVFWARESIGAEAVALWLDTYQMSREFQKRGIVELWLS